MAATRANAEGNQLYFRGNYSAASAKFEDALRMATEEKDEQYRAIAMYGLARSSAHLCRPADADKWFRASIELREKLPDDKYAKRTQNDLEYSRYLISQRRVAEAVPYMDRAIPSLEALDIEKSDPIAYADFLDAYVAILKEQSRAADAEKAAHRASELRTKYPDKKARFKPEMYPSDCPSSPTNK